MAKLTGYRCGWLPAIPDELQTQRLIQKGASDRSLPGLTTAQTLEQTASIFDGASPGPCERGAIDLAERTSAWPPVNGSAAEYVSDIYRTGHSETGEFLQQCEQIGFFDVLSGDAHGSRDAEGLEQAQTIRAVLLALSERVAQVRKDRAELKGAVGRLTRPRRAEECDSVPRGRSEIQLHFHGTCRIFINAVTGFRVRSAGVTQW